MIGELCGLAAAACWAVGSLLFSRIGKSTTPEAMNLGKCLSAGLLLSGTALAVGGGGGVFGPGLGWLALSAVAGLTIGDTAYFGALVRLGMAPALLLLSAAPAFTAVGGWLFLGEQLTSIDGAGIGAVTAGIALVVWQPGAPGAPERKLGPGIVLGIVAAMGQAAGSLLSKQAMLLGVTPLEAGGSRLLIGGVVLAAALALRGRLAPSVVALRSERTWLRVTAASLVGSYAGIWLAQVAIDRAKSTGIAATLLATSPIFAIPIARLAGETIRARAVAGAVLGVGGVALLTLGDAIFGG